MAGNVTAVMPIATEYEFSVPSNAVGTIIGQKGRQINGIQDQTGCRIQILDADNTGSLFRTCKVSGSKEGVAKALDMLMQVVANSARMEEKRERERDNRTDRRRQPSRRSHHQTPPHPDVVLPVPRMPFDPLTFGFGRPPFLPHHLMQPMFMPYSPFHAGLVPVPLPPQVPLQLPVPPPEFLDTISMLTLQGSVVPQLSTAPPSVTTEGLGPGAPLLPVNPCFMPVESSVISPTVAYPVAMPGGLIYPMHSPQSPWHMASTQPVVVSSPEHDSPEVQQSGKPGCEDAVEPGKKIDLSELPPTVQAKVFQQFFQTRPLKESLCLSRTCKLARKTIIDMITELEKKDFAALDSGLQDTPVYDLKFGHFDKLQGFFKFLQAVGPRLRRLYMNCAVMHYGGSFNMQLPEMPALDFVHMQFCSWVGVNFVDKLVARAPSVTTAVVSGCTLGHLTNGDTALGVGESAATYDKVQDPMRGRVVTVPEELVGDGVEETAPVDDSLLVTPEAYGDTMIHFLHSPVVLSKKLLGWRSLEKVGLINWEVSMTTSRMGRSFGGFRSLKALDLRANTLWVPATSEILSLDTVQASLEELRVTCFQTCEPWNIISGLHKCTNLTFVEVACPEGQSWTWLTDMVLIELRSLKKLSHLHLGGGNYSSNAMIQLFADPEIRLKKLCLYGMALSDDTVRAVIMNNPTLEVLMVQSSTDGVTDSSLWTLQNTLPRLRILFVASPSKDFNATFFQGLDPSFYNKLTFAFAARIVSGHMKTWAPAEVKAARLRFKAAGSKAKVDAFNGSFRQFAESERPKLAAEIARDSKGEDCCVWFSFGLTHPEEYVPW